MTKDEALKLALEALVEVKSWKSPTRWDGCFDKEITAIKEALNGCQCPECQAVLHTSDCAVHNEPAYPKGQCNCGATKQEPVAFINVEQRKLEWAKYMSWDTPTVVNLPKIPLYTTPIQRTWVGLTDEDISEIVRGTHNTGSFVRAIEAKLKEKNT